MRSLEEIRADHDVERSGGPGDWQALKRLLRDVPDLVAEVERLTEENAEMRQDLAGWRTETICAPVIAERDALAARLESTDRAYSQCTELLNETGMERDELRAEVERLRANQWPDWSRMLTNQSCPEGEHPDWFIDSEHSHPCPWCERDALRAKVQDVLDQQTEWCSQERVDVPSWVSTVVAALAGAAPQEGATDEKP